MKKPIILRPFIYVYKGLAVIITFLLTIFQYASIGSYLLISSIIEIIVKFIIGLFKLIVVFLEYLVKGIAFVLVLLCKFIILLFKGIFTVVVGILLFIKEFIKNLRLGVKATSIFLLNSIRSLIKHTISLFNYVGIGMLIIIRGTVYFIKHLSIYSKIGIVSLFVFLQLVFERFIDTIYSVNVKKRMIWKKFLEYRAKQKKLRLEKRIRANAIKNRKKVKALAKREEAREERIRRKLDNKKAYVNKSVKVDTKKKTFGDLINDALLSLAKIRDSFKKSISFNFEKQREKKLKIEKDSLMMNLMNEEEQKDKKKVKILYEYVAKDQNGKTVKGYFEAYSKMEVRSFLINEGMEVYSIRTNWWISLMHRDTASGNVKVKTKDLIFFLTQLSTYIKAGIPLAEALEILSRQFKNKHYQRIFKSLVYDLNLGLNLSEAMEKQGIAFPRLLINMVKASEMTGSLPEVLDDQANYFTETEETRKQMVTALMYPLIVAVIAIGVTVFIMLFVVPKFVEIFESMDASSIPWITVAIMSLSDFLKHNIIFIIIGFIIIVVVFRYLYKNVRLFRRRVQIILMHMPVFKNVIIYNEVTIFTKTFASLMQHNVFITDTMQILRKISGNEIYKELIDQTIVNLSTGEKISKAYQGHWAFPLPAYEMLVTGERTGELPEMMAKVSEYYQGLHRDAVARIKVFIEPILIILLTGVTGVIVLSIVIPMFSMYNSIQ